MQGPRLHVLRIDAGAAKRKLACHEAPSTHSARTMECLPQWLLQQHWERRERVRKERMDEQNRNYEKKLQISMKRSMQAPKKKTGKPVMFRSRPARRREAKQETAEEDADAADAQFFA